MKIEVRKSMIYSMSIDMDVGPTTVNSVMIYYLGLAAINYAVKNNFRRA